MKDHLFKARTSFPRINNFGTETFMTMIGNVNKDLWPTLRQGDTYQTIIGNDVKDRYGTAVFLLLLFMNCNL